MHKYLFKVFSILLIFTSITFNAQLLQSDVPWNDDESGYYTIKNNNIILVSATGENDQIILSALKTKNLNIESFVFSNSKNKVLLFTNSVKVWRYRTRGDYFVYDFEKNNMQQIGKEMPISSLMFAKFSPDENYVAYVSKENSENSNRNSTTRANIFLESLDDSSVKKLTSSEGTEKLINGTFDWVYEEEFSCRDGFLFNEDGTKIAYWQVDANQVKDFFMINNTDSIYSSTIPVEYPKVGEPVTPVKIGVIDLYSGKTTWMKVGDSEEEFYHVF